MKNQPGPNSVLLVLQKATSRIPGFIFFITALLSTYQSKAQVRELANDKAKMDERVRSTLKENAQTIQFLENKGQLENKDVLYYFQNGNNAVYVEKDRIRFVALKDTLVENDEEHEEAQTEIEPQQGERSREILGSHTFSLYLNGSNPKPGIKLGDAFTTKYNYFLGDDPKAWVSGVRASKELTLEDIYPGINLRLYSNSDGSMEFDWVMDAGADYSKVKMHFEGQDGLFVDPDGSLKVGLRFTDVKFNIPESYQVTDQGKVPVSFSFTQSNDNTIQFTTQSSIDARYPIVIDPTLSWGSFFDANNTGFDDYLFAVQVDPADGMLYCAGGTNRQVPTNAAPYDANGYLNLVIGLNGAADALPHVAVIYRVNSSGTDIVDLTLYGPSIVTSSDNTLAHGLSLSTNNVFISGVTTSTIPTPGSPFDGTRNNGDGFVAIFTKDLGTLNYATYLGGTGDEVLGVTSIRALSDNSFVAGLTANAALPAGYISGSAADNTFGTGSEMYIAKFTSNNTLSWGTYVGGTSDEVFNDLEVFADGRVAFAGYGTGQLTEVNSAAGRSTNTNNTDGIIGVLNATGTTFNYLDEIGGTNNDRINDVEIVGETLYWTGSAESGFPVPASGVFDSSQNGGTDVVVGSVSAAGTTGYNATFYGTSAGDLGNGIRLVTSTNCAGVTTTFLLVFGTVGGSGLPTQNIGAETLFNNTYQGGLDMFFAGFSSNLATLTYGTYMGGVNDDYLGSTGDPRGANHLWVNNVNVYLGTTTHNSTHMPTLVAGGFDLTRTNEASGEDTHLILSIQFPSFIESDYSDAPATYGVPSHTLDCPHLKIGTLLDAESAAAPTTIANGDDLTGIDDEDGISTLPSFSDGGPQNISVTVNNISNTTGSTANLYGWIDFNSNGQFEANEFTSTTVATGFSGSKVLTWTGVTVSGPAANHYLRIRLTTNTLNDNGGTPTVDERSTASASNGEVEDYRAIDLTCPTATTSSPCLTQAQINTAYSTWLATAKAGGGCNDGTLTNNSSGAPTACVGGTSTVTFTYTSACAPITTTCMSTFTVPADASPVIVTCAAPRTITGCGTGSVTTPIFSAVSAASTEAVFESAPNNGNTTDDCAITAVTYIDVASGSCPVIVTRKWTVSDACGHSATCNQTITVQDNSSTAPVIMTCAVNRNISGCTTADITGPAFSSVSAASTEAVFESAPNNGNTSDNCGITSVNYIDVASGSCPITVIRKWTISDGCGNSSTCNQTITITDSTPPTASNPSPTSVQCIASVPAPDPLVVTTEADNCSIPTVVLLSNTNNGGAGCAASPYIATRIYRVTDACGNTVNVTHTITAIDNTPPTASNPAPTSVQCIADVPAADPLVVTTEADNCSTPIVTLLSNTNNGGAGCAANPYIATRIYRVTDACGNTVNVTHTITAIDNTAPVIITCAVTRTIQGCNTTVITTPPFSATTATSSESVFESSPNSGNTSDNCGISTVNYIDVASGTCPIVVTRRWTVSDACGNTSTCNQTINITDTTPPTASNPAPTSVQCIANVPAPDPLVVTTEADNCSTPTVILLSNTNNGGAGCTANPYIETRIYRVTDACGNTVNVTHTVTAIDNTPPTASNPAPTSVQCIADIPAPDPLVVTTEADNCTTPTVTVLSNTNNGGAGCAASPYIATRIYRVTDACGNTVNVTQTITAIDNTAPVIVTCATTRTIQGCNTTVITTPPFSATTATSSESVFESSPNSGNTSDNCGISTVNYIDVASGSCPIVVTRRWTVSDACGNTATCNQTINITDTTPPTASNPAPTAVQCVANVPAPDPLVVTTEADNCSTPTVTLLSNTNNGGSGCPASPFVATRIYRVTDACGNTVNVTHTVTAIDNTPPTASNPAPTSVQCIADIPAPDPLVVINEADNCSTPTVTLLSNTNNGGAGCAASPYIATRIYRVTDACGNTANVTHTLTAIDNTAPVIVTCATTRTIEGCNTSVILTPPFSATTAVSSESIFETSPNNGNTSDNCGISTVTYIDVATGNCPIVVTRRWTVSDACGNTATCNQTINITDTTPPTASNPAPTSVQCIADIPAPDPLVVTTEADNCSTPIVTLLSNTNNGGAGCAASPYIATRIYRVTDACGNTVNVTHTLTAIDNTAPVIITCAVSRIIDGCNTSAILNPPFSATTATSSESVFETSPNNGNTSDNCGISSVTYRDVAVGSCPIVVTRRWTVSDACGNTATCNQTITVRDITPPVCQTQNITVTVDPLSGQASITPSQVNNGSSDACSSVTLAVSPSNFSCSNSGPNTVVLTVTDACGNTSTCTATVTVTGCADLSLTKTVSYNSITNVATFTITVTNHGPSPATGIEATDQLPNGYAYVSNTPSQGTYNNISGVWLVGNLAVNASATLLLNATVNAGIGLNYLNKAQITEDQQYDPDSDPETNDTVDDLGDGITDDDEASATLSTADLSLTKTAGIYNPVTNQIIFTITVLNSGPTTATNVKVTDQLPNGYTYVSNVPSQGSYNNITGLWTIGTMPNGASVILTITATVKTGIGLNYTNAAQITDSDQIDPDSNPHTGPTIDEDGDGNGDDDDEDNVTPIIADLSLTKTAGIFNPVTNQLVFTLTILNSGPNTATGVDVTDQLPSGYTYVSSVPSQGSYNNVTGLWTVGVLANGVSRTLTITAIVNTGNGLQYTNAAQVTHSDQIDPDSSPNTGPLVDEDGNGNGDDDDEDNATPIIADLSLTKTSGIFNPVNNQLTFTITVLNSGPNDATNVLVTDQLPNGYTYVSNTTSPGTSYNNVTGLWTIGSIINGATKTLTITAIVNTGNGLQYTNAAQITNSDQIDPDSSPDTGPLVDENGDGNGDDDDEDNATPLIADLSLTKTAGLFNPVNNQLVFTITVLNSGPNDATNVQVTDQLPNGYTYVSNTTSPGTSYNNVTGLWIIGSILNGASKILTITAIVNTGTGLQYTNAAQVTNSDQIDPDSSPDTGPLVDEDGNGNGDDDDEDNATPLIADLSLTKTAGTFNPVNNQLVFTITLFNNGPNDATNVQVTDQLPNGYTYVSNTTTPGTSYNNVSGLWTIGSILNGASKILTITAIVNTGNGLQYTNATQITNSDQIDPDSSPDTGPLVDENGDGNGDDDDEDNATPIIADLSLTKTVGIYNPVTNQIVFTITILNNGPDGATGVQVTDQLPSGYTYVSSTPSQGTYNNVTGLWNIGVLANGISRTLTITATVNTGTGLIYTNPAQVTNSDQIDPDSSPDTGPLVDEDGNGNGDDDDEDNATPLIADLSLTKTAGIFNPVTNQLIFTITVLNSGPNDATNVQVTDQLPNGYTYVSNTTSPGTSYNNVTGLWTIGSILNGGSKILTITAIVNTGNGLQYTNAAQITNSDQIDPDSSPDTGPLVDEDGNGNGDDDDEDNATPLIADLSLSKTSGIFNPVTNQLVFTITVLNSGPNDATNVQVTDQLPNGYTYVSNTTSPGTSYNNVTGLWTIGSILNGASKILTITAVVNTGNGLQYTNAAQITNSDQIDPDSSPDTGPTVDEDGNGNGDDDDEDNATPLIADLSLTKTVGLFNPVNNQLVFTITVNNAGPNGATGVQVTDQLPNAYTYVSSVPSQGTYANGTGLWTIGSLANGGSATLTITVTVNTGTGLVFANAAQITNSDQIDPDSSPDTGPTVDEDGNGNGDDDDEDTVTPLIADLSLTKTSGLFNPVNNQLVFTITILNSGPDGATGVQVTDQLPNGYTFVSSTPSQGSYANGTGLWTVGSIANGGSATLAITVTVNTGTGLVFANAAQITNSDQIDPDSSPDTGPTVDEDGNGNGDDDDEDTVTPLIADLSLSKTAGIFNPINNQLVFTVTILNSGPNGATGVQVTDQLPNGYTFVSSSPSQGSYNNITGLWTVGSLANGSSATLTISTTVLTGTGLLYTNAAQITNSDQIDPDSSPDTGPTVDEDGNGNGDDDDEDNATPLIADLSLTKTIASYNSTTNQVVFTISVLNSGPNGATGVKVTDLLPNGFTYVSNTPSQGSYNNVTGLWTIGSMTNGASATLMITATVNSGAGLVYTNAAQITDEDQIDPDSSPDTGPLVDEDGNGNGDDDDEDNVTLPVSDLSLTKTVNNNSPNQNSNITYTITVMNSGPDNATGVTVKDLLPAGLAYVSDVASVGSYNNVSGIWTIGSLANGASQTLQIVATVTGSGTIVNFAEINNADQADPDSDPHTSFNQDDHADNVTDDDESSVAITVNCGTCNVINGPTSPVCPGTTSTFNAQVAGLCNNPVYHWTVTGNVLNYVPNGSSVTVTAGSLCGQTYTVSVSIDCESCGTSPIVCMTNVLVQDATPPVIIACAAPRTIQGCGTGAISDPPYSATIVTSSEDVFENLTNNGNATDGCGIATVTYVDISTGVCPTVVTRRWTVSDACGNSATCNQTISVNDTTNPVISACAVTRTIEGCSTSVITNPPFSNVTVITTEAVFENAPNNGNTSDNCGVVAVTYKDVASGSCPIVVMRRWTVTDACGNTSTCNQTINVTDTTVPFFTSCPGNSVINCPATPVFGTPAASDLCDASVAITSSDLTTPGNCPGRYNLTRTWTATDDCGNTATCSATITVKDDTAPQIHCPSDLVLTCDAGLNYPALINAWIATATASDACDANVSITTNYDGMSYPSFSCQGGMVITFTATDDCGNTSTCSATVTKPCFNLETWVYLEGSAVNPNGGNTYTLPMRTSLNDLHVLPGQLLVDPFFGNKYSPPGQPYTIAPWNYPGTEGSLFDSGGNPNNATAGYPSTVVDWVLVSLRLDSAGTVGPVSQSAALLHKDGTIQFVKPLNSCGVNENQLYYVVIEHRNHLLVMSNSKVAFINHKLSYDFRFQQSWEDPLFAGLNLFAREKEILPGQFAMFAANGQETISLNADTDINFDDRSFWESQNGAVGFYRIGDYNLNGDTNFNDRIVWERNNGKFTSVPRN